MALLAYEADLCECGQPRSESMEARNEDAYRAEPLRCHACAAIAHGAERFVQPNAKTAGLFFSVTKTRGVTHG